MRELLDGLRAEVVEARESTQYTQSFDGEGIAEAAIELLKSFPDLTMNGASRAKPKGSSSSDGGKYDDCDDDSDDADDGFGDGDGGFGDGDGGSFEDIASALGDAANGWSYVPASESTHIGNSTPK